MFVGTGKRLEPVSGGRQEPRACPRCGQTTVFYEKQMSRTLSLYFVDVAAFDPKRVMACGACGASYLVDDAAPKSFAEAQRGTAVGAVAEAADRARQALSDGSASRTARQVTDAATDALDGAGRWLRKRFDK